MGIVFNQRVKHGTRDFHPGVVYAFEDPDAAPYFVACGWAEETGADPAVTISLGEIDIDPGTTWASGPMAGRRVLDAAANTGG